MTGHPCQQHPDPGFVVLRGWDGGFTRPRLSRPHDMTVQRFRKMWGSEGSETGQTGDCEVAEMFFYALWFHVFAGFLLELDEVRQLCR